MTDAHSFNRSLWQITAHRGVSRQVELFGDDTVALRMLAAADGVSLVPPGQKWTCRFAGLAEVGVDIEAEESSEGLCYRLACVAEPVEEDNAEA